MKRFTARPRRLFAPFLIAALCLACAGAAPAQHLPITTQAGHVSPLMARLTDPSGKTRDVMITGSSQGGPYLYRGWGMAAET